MRKKMFAGLKDISLHAGKMILRQPNATHAKASRFQSNAVVEEDDMSQDPCNAMLLDPSGALESVEADRDDEMLHSVVKMKLGSFCVNPQIVKTLNTMVMDMNRVLAEAYEFANFHIVRLLEENTKVTMPTIDHNFYYRAIIAVTVSGCRATTLGVDMQASIALFDALRPPNTTKVDIRGSYNQVVASLSNVMSTMASNHLWTNLEPRLTQYLRWRYPTMYGRNTIVRAVATQPRAKLDELFTGARMQPAKAVAQDLRNIMALPGAAHFASRCHLTLPIYHHILSETEAAIAARAETPDCGKKARFRQKTFTMLPLKHGFTLSHIPVSEMMFLRVLKDLKLESFQQDGRSLDRSQKRAIWAKHCNLNGVETQARRFGFHITTDGRAVSVLLKRQACVGCPQSHPDAKELARLFASGSIADTVGVDPGISDVVSCSRVSTSDTTTHYSSARYYQKAMFNMTRRRTDAWNSETIHLLTGLTSARTCRVALLSQHISGMLACVTPMLQHRALKGYRNMRFLRFRSRQKAIHEICVLVAPLRTDGNVTIVGFGDFSLKNSPVRRKTCGPLKDIRRRLRERADVVLLDIDEFRTSVTCHCCRNMLVNMRAVTTRKSREERTGATCPHWATGHNMVKSVGRSKVHKVLHCSSNDKQGQPCCGTTWNRDVNASKNMLELTMCITRGYDRPAAFCRQTVEPKKKRSKKEVTVVKQAIPCETPSPPPPLVKRKVVYKNKI